MIYVWLVIGGLVLYLLARLSRRPPPRRASFGDLTVAERGDIVGYDDEDAGLGTGSYPKLADNLSVGIRFDYRDASGRGSLRTVLIDGVYGESLDWPSYIVGVDQGCMERRTFRLDRIGSLHTVGGAPLTGDDIPWRIGNVVREAAGLSSPPCPFRASLGAVVSVHEISDSGKTRRTRTGRVVDFELSYGPRGPIIRMTVDGAITSGSAYLAESCVTYQISPPKTYGWRAETIFDAGSGEVIEDLTSWAVRLAETGSATAT